MTAPLLQILAERSARAAFLAAKGAYWRLRPVSPERRRRVLVAGVQRSGTNMLMDILEKSWRIDAYHERDPRAFDHYAMRPLPVIDQLVERSPFPVFAIKSLFELQILPELMEHLAPAQVLWIVRDYNDTINSTLKSFSRNLVERIQRAVRPDTEEWIGDGMSEDTRRRLTPLVHPKMAPADAAAVQWYLRNILFFENGFEGHAQVLVLSYEKLVTAPRAQIERICRFIDVPCSPRLSRGIFSSSIGKRTPPQLSPEVEALCRELTQRFEPLMEA